MATSPKSSQQEIRKQIETVIRDGLEATRTMDIERFMATIPASHEMNTPDGQVVSREELRAETLQQWSTIRQVLEAETKIESLIVHDDHSAVVVTAQRYRRLMNTRDGKSFNDVLTTQRHRETWHLLPEGWRCTNLQELGGEIFVDGKPFNPTE